MELTGYSQTEATWQEPNMFKRLQDCDIQRVPEPKDPKPETPNP